MKLPKLRELKEAVIALIKGPYTTKYPFQPHTPMPKFRGKTQFFDDDCVGCGACSQVCPAHTIEVEDIVDKEKKTGKRVITLYHENCIFCGNCVQNCITQKGIRQTQEFDLATYDRKSVYSRVEKELVLCQCCGEPITTVEHLEWITQKVAESGFASPSLYLSHLKSLGLAHYEDIVGLIPFKRARRQLILCHKCRRESTLEK
ncbi:MAG: 4Fe-4S dicluster domain-containing protein [Candidatus Omnitrophica bacterium]|nr:4Fe-4S dicluster domain-containing protein [Candidatus Omnitrophota bacterium]